MEVMFWHGSSGSFLKPAFWLNNTDNACGTSKVLTCDVCLFGTRLYVSVLQPATLMSSQKPQIYADFLTSAIEFQTGYSDLVCGLRDGAASCFLSQFVSLNISQGDVCCLKSSALCLLFPHLPECAGMLVISFATCWGPLTALSSRSSTKSWSRRKYFSLIKKKRW